MIKTVNQSVFLWKSMLGSCCCHSVTQSFSTLCDPTNYSTPGFPVLHYLLEFAQTHVHWVDDTLSPFLSLELMFATIQTSVVTLDHI